MTGECRTNDLYSVRVERKLAGRAAHAIGAEKSFHLFGEVAGLTGRPRIAKA
jgi:hypothetical protein